MQTQMRIYRICKTETTFPRCDIEYKREKLALPRSGDVDAWFAFGDLADHGNVREALLQEQRQDLGDRIRRASDEQAPRSLRIGQQGFCRIFRADRSIDRHPVTVTRPVAGRGAGLETGLDQLTGTRQYRQVGVADRGPHAAALTNLIQMPG